MNTMTQTNLDSSSISLTDLRCRIEKALEQLAMLDAQNLVIEIDEGGIVLRGKVRSMLEREEAEAASWATPGVSDVENRITVWH